MSQVPGPVDPQHQVVSTPPAAEHAVVTERAVVADRVVSRRRWAIDAVVVGIVGVVSTIVGLIAVARAGLDGPMSDPVVDVLGLQHTATLGLIEAGIGILLIVSAASLSRPGAVFLGLVLVIGGAVVVAEPESLVEQLAVESAHGWLAIVAGAIVVAVSLLVPRAVSTTSRLERTDVI
jgi:hypothetical protein